MMNSTHNPNRSLVRIFGIALSGLLMVYSMIAVYGLFELENISAAELSIGMVRIALGPLALLVLFRWGWRADPLDRQVRRMGATFEAGYANLSTKTRIRSIVLVTMLSLLLELVLIRCWRRYFRFFRSTRISRCWPASWVSARATRWRNGSPARRRWYCRCSSCLSGSSRFCDTIPASCI